ncbi:uncharacterized protein C8A04DRAFT_31978 [Dichotomopilus funicola]|uniref:Uncharacterized protein n=1 Tax=Dichotomopilus funicola TaxID=1934379 RepID=A0AAN6ZJ86_9PEZI|nr:hypothetical protein C8A04DRAFT_31978 [Dichotomopilus funicola]
MNPYKNDPTKTTPSDLYADIPNCGRYGLTSSGFQPDPAYLLSTSPKTVWSKGRDYVLFDENKAMAA